VRVEAGDVIVADGDGVVVVPQDIAAEVARRAKLILDKDKVARRRLYEQLGWDPDESVTIE
jgi:regulator of RNase E activity RraA